MVISRRYSQGCEWGFTAINASLRRHNGGGERMWKMTSIKKRTVLFLFFFAASHLSHAQVIAAHPLFSDGRGVSAYSDESPKTIMEDLFSPEDWLYLGFRLGSGSSDWFYYEDKTHRVIRQPVTILYNFNMAFQVSAQVLPFLALQTEMLFTTDFNSTGKITSGETSEGGLLSMWAIHIPFLVKFTINHYNLKVGIFGGINIYLPLFETGDESVRQYFSYKPDQPGLVFGASFGYKLGPGFLFLDGRFEYDGHWRTDEKTDAMYYRNLVKFGIGYEFGLIKRSK
jgi:hypothetical protein